MSPSGLLFSVLALVLLAGRSGAGSLGDWTSSSQRRLLSPPEKSPAEKMHPPKPQTRWRSSAKDASSLATKMQSSLSGLAVGLHNVVRRSRPPSMYPKYDVPQIGESSLFHSFYCASVNIDV